MRYPLSFAQLRYWSLDGPAAVLRRARRLDGPVDPDALRRAVDAAVVRHAALRTSVVTVDGEPEQVVADTAELPVAHEESAEPFDLATPPLARVALVGPPEQPSLVVSAHRVVADGPALDLLLDELCTAYGGGELPELWMDYGDYAVWHRERLAGEELERQLAPWRETLRDAPAGLPLPADPPSTPSWGEVTAEAPGDQAAALAAYAVVLSRYARQRDLVIALPVSGRVRAELERIVGPFADVVPLRVSVTGTFAELHARVRGSAAEALSHDELPFDKLAAELGVARPVVGFSTTGQAWADFPLADFQLDAGENGTLRLAYRADVYATPFAERFLRSVVAVLEHAGQHPDTPVADLPLQPGQEAVAPTVPDLDVVRALRESAASVTDSTGTVPMPEVCRRAAVLARVIAEQGTDHHVGVCVRRGVGLLVAVLGTWWAGRTAVLLDPDLPLPGLEKSVRKSGLKLVVTEEEHVPIGDATVITSAEGEPIDAAEPNPVAYVVDGRDVTHRAVADVLAVLRRDLPLGPGDRFAAVGAAVDVALMELLLPLVCGADVVVTDGRNLDGITALHASAYTWRHLPTVPDSVRLRLCTGLTPELAEALDTPGTELWHLHGDAESALWPVAGRWPATNRSGAGILDERGVPVPIGAIGEVHVGEHATGDLARWREDGRLDLVGRTDAKVEVRGRWVDPGGIAAELRTHRAVRDAVVIGAPKDGETALVAYVVSDESGEGLRRHLRATLPERMVPELFVALDELSDTLPEPDWGQPRDDVERTMARIWADLLRTTDRIAVHDNLFGRGAGSLTVMRFAAKVAEAYGVNLPLHRIFATPTIAALAAIVTAERQPEPDDGLAELSDTELDDLLRSVLAARDRRRTARGEAT
ncbi:hypothetical protein ADK67_25570 [Saccharothrix sp. NRRL B-16348]|uniref:condensation domain-containing protein n=1 Tax=Saccharothrix sp. NRRL B-16348 TaxID=1415542 RepID=UPI0006AFD2F2|nr:condensation domain-containing protein [Saccharothrix sp. NRRL B-16348]KOX21732.1 hypothetical protein ADK67_25570 [Saccharothrix sp. NRRL B-16348]